MNDDAAQAEVCSSEALGAGHNDAPAELLRLCIAALRRKTHSKHPDRSLSAALELLELHDLAESTRALRDRAFPRFAEKPAPGPQLTHEQATALHMMLDHYGNDPRNKEKQMNESSPPVEVASSAGLGLEPEREAFEAWCPCSVQRDPANAEHYALAAANDMWAAWMARASHSAVSDVLWEREQKIKQCNRCGRYENGSRPCPQGDALCPMWEPMRVRPNV